MSNPVCGISNASPFPMLDDGEGQIYAMLLVRYCDHVAPLVGTRKANPNFLIPVSVPPNGVDLGYFKLRLFDLK